RSRSAGERESAGEILSASEGSASLVSQDSCALPDLQTNHVRSGRVASTLAYKPSAALKKPQPTSRHSERRAWQSEETKPSSIRPGCSCGTRVSMGFS